MASVPSKTVKLAAAMAITGLLILLLPSVVVPLLPPLQPLTSQLLTRLREAAAFLAFTTAIAAGIFSTQHKDVHHEKHKNAFLENHPLASIFGEPGHEEADLLYGGRIKLSSLPSPGKKGQSHDTMRGNDDADTYQASGVSSARSDGGNPLWSDEVAMGASWNDQPVVTSMKNGSVRELNVQRMLHRKSSSLDDSVNFELEPRSPKATHLVSQIRTTSNGQGVKGNKPIKRVSFSLASSPSSPKHVEEQEHREPLEKIELRGSSPGDLTGQADAFIAKFKEQLRMQQLESFKRNQRHL